MSKDFAAFMAARYDEAERTIYQEGSPPHGVIAWLTYLEPDGSMGYSTVASGDSEDGPWIADGRVLPEPASVLVVYDPVRALRGIAAKRAVLALHAEDPLGGFGALRLPGNCRECSCDGAMAATDCFHLVDWPCATALQLGTEFSGHPDYDPDWKP